MLAGIALAISTLTAAISVTAYRRLDRLGRQAFDFYAREYRAHTEHLVVTQATEREVARLRSVVAGLCESQDEQDVMLRRLASATAGIQVLKPAPKLHEAIAAGDGHMLDTFLVAFDAPKQ